MNTNQNIGGIILNDLLISTKEETNLTLLFQNKKMKNERQIYLFNEFELITILKIEMKKLIFDPKKTLFLYPGESAQNIKKAGFSDNFFSESIFAKRIWIPGNEPIVITHGLVMEKYIYPEINNIIVVDDVISSGLTLSLVYKRNVWKFPKATWYAMALISRKEKILNFKETFFCIYVKEINGKKIPINSLSTLLSNTEIRKSYFARNFDSIFEQKFFEIFKEK